MISVYGNVTFHLDKTTGKFLAANGTQLSAKFVEKIIPHENVRYFHNIQDHAACNRMSRARKTWTSHEPHYYYLCVLPRHVGVSICLMQYLNMHKVAYRTRPENDRYKWRTPVTSQVGQSRLLQLRIKELNESNPTARMQRAWIETTALKECCHICSS